MSVIQTTRLFLSAFAVSLLLAAMPLSAASDDGMEEASLILFTGSIDARFEALKTIVARKNPDMLPTLILAIRFGLYDEESLNWAAEQITGDPGTGWFDWMLWQEAHPEFPAHESYVKTKLAMFSRIDPNFLKFLNEKTTDPANMKIRLEEISWGGVRVDGIPSLDNPTLIDADAATYMRGDDLVFGVAINGDARAYPLRIMGWHEMFNDVIGGVPVALAYCTLCGAGILFETGDIAGQDTPLVFGSSGFLYRSNKLMFDRKTNSLWNQFTGQPVMGPLVHSGIKLKQRPVVITSWDAWKAENPSTKILSLNTGHRRDYGSGVVYSSYFASPNLMFPALVDQSRLKQKEYVFGIRLPLNAKAWPIGTFAGGRVLNDAIGATNLVLIGNAATRTVRAYDRGDILFHAGATAGQLTDSEGGDWTVQEDALISQNTRAPRIAGHIAYWFAWDSYLGVQSELFAE